jgi:hypothetical protein
MAETRDLSTILDAKIPIIVIESPDEQRVLALLLRFAMKRGLSFCEWRVTTPRAPGKSRCAALTDRRRQRRRAGTSGPGSEIGKMGIAANSGRQHADIVENATVTEQ